MKVKELIRQLKEYEKIYGPDMEVITNKYEKATPDSDFISEEIVDGLDYIGDSKILITSHEE